MIGLFDWDCCLVAESLLFWWRCSSSSWSPGRSQCGSTTAAWHWKDNHRRQCTSCWWHAISPTCWMHQRCWQCGHRWFQGHFSECQCCSWVDIPVNVQLGVSVELACVICLVQSWLVWFVGSSSVVAGELLQLMMFCGICHLVAAGALTATVTLLAEDWSVVAVDWRCSSVGWQSFSWDSRSWRSFDGPGLGGVWLGFHGLVEFWWPGGVSTAWQSLLQCKHLIWTTPCQQNMSFLHTQCQFLLNKVFWVFQHVLTSFFQTSLSEDLPPVLNEELHCALQIWLGLFAQNQAVAAVVWNFFLLLSPSLMCFGLTSNRWSAAEVLDFFKLTSFNSFCQTTNLGWSWLSNVRDVMQQRLI